MNQRRGEWPAAQSRGYADHGPGWGLGVAASHITWKLALRRVSRIYHSRDRIGASV